jgi:hypothetical protein
MQALPPGLENCTRWHPRRWNGINCSRIITLNALSRSVHAIEAIDRATTEERRAAKIADGAQQPQTRSLHED